MSNVSGLGLRLGPAGVVSASVNKTSIRSLDSTF